MHIVSVGRHFYQQVRDLTQLITNFNETFSGQQISSSLVSLYLEGVSMGGNDSQAWCEL